MSKRSLTTENLFSNVDNIEDNKRIKSEVQLPVEELDKATSIISNASDIPNIPSNSQEQQKDVISLALNYYGEASVLYKSKNFLGATENYEKAINLLTENDTYRATFIKGLVYSYRELATTLHNSGNFLGATENYEKAINRLPENDTYRATLIKELAYSYHDLATMLHNSGNFLGATENYKKAINLLPEDDTYRSIYTKELAYSYQALALMLHNSGNFLRATENYEKAINRLPENDTYRATFIKGLAHVWKLQGEFFYESSNYTKASESFREGIKISLSLKSVPGASLESIVEISQLLILALLEGNEKYNDLIHVLDEVVNACGKILEILPSNPNPEAIVFCVYAHNKIGNILLNYDKDAARTHYLECLKLINPPMEERTDLRPIDQLLKIITQYTESKIKSCGFPKHYLALENTQHMSLLKMAEIQLNNLKVAKNSEGAVDLSNYYHSLGETYHLLSCKDKINATKLLKQSVEFFQKSGTNSSLSNIIKIDPKGLFSSTESIVNHLGEYLFLKGDIDKTLVYYNHYIKLTPNNLDANLTLSRLYSSKGEITKFIEHLNIARSLYSELYKKLNEAMKLSVTVIKEGIGGPAIIRDSEYVIHQPIAENELNIKPNYGSIISIPSSIVDTIFAYYTGDSKLVERTHDGEKLLGSINDNT